MVPCHIEDQVIPPTLPGEVLPGVIDDPVCTDRSDHIHVPWATHPGHVRSERLGDLHGKRTPPPPPPPARRAPPPPPPPPPPPAPAAPPPPPPGPGSPARRGGGGGVGTFAV